MKRHFLATIQLVIECEDGDVPEENFIGMVDKLSGDIQEWRYFLSAPHYGFFMPYAYDPQTFQQEER